MTKLERDTAYMRQALGEAQAASLRGEVPVGAVLVDPQSDRVIARTGNAPIGICDPTAHAEVLALRDGAYKTGNYRLTGLTLYVTLEPCAHHRPEVSGGLLADEAAAMLKAFFKARRKSKR